MKNYSQTTIDVYIRYLFDTLYLSQEGRKRELLLMKNHELIDWHLFSLVGNLGDSSIEQIVV